MEECNNVDSIVTELPEGYEPETHKALWSCGGVPGSTMRNDVSKIVWQQMGTKRKSQIDGHAHPFPSHAKEQLKERYDVEFSDSEWVRFGQVLRDPNWTIRLSDAKRGGYYCASFFMEHWYLLICARDGTVKTAIPRLDVMDEDKLILMRDDRYLRINNDEFRVWRTPPVDTEVRSRKKPVKLPENEELPTCVSQSAESMLNRLCSKEK